MVQSNTRAARQISYANSAQTRPGKTLIRLMENGTGRIGLIKRAQGFEDELERGRGFFDVMADRFGLTLEVVRGSLASIPDDGPVIFIANHPYGILDGLMLGRIMSRYRSSFRILAHSVFSESPLLSPYVLPISFDPGKASVALNLATRKAALSHLADGGALGIFPGGTVSTAAKPFSRPLDPEWRCFTARLVGASRARVVPIYFDGHTSRMFQLACHIHYTLRMGLMIKEFKDRVDTPVRVAIGQTIERDVLDPIATDRKALMTLLRRATYQLSSDPSALDDLGYEFEERYRN